MADVVNEENGPSDIGYVEWVEMRTGHLKKMSYVVLEAFETGMSVVQICRSMGKRSCRKVYDLLVGLEAFEAPKRAGRGVILKGEIGRAMSRMECPFDYWCAEHGVLPQDGFRMLQSLPEGDEEDSAARIHRAIRRDFPNPYKYDFGVEPPEYIPAYSKEKLQASLTITWDKDSEKFIAMVLENTKIKVVGKNRTEALERVEMLIDIDKQIKRLKTAIMNMHSDSNELM